jgi:hypothetical protein
MACVACVAGSLERPFRFIRARGTLRMSGEIPIFEATSIELVDAPK